MKKILVLIVLILSANYNCTFAANKYYQSKSPYQFIDNNQTQTGTFKPSNSNQKNSNYVNQTKKIQQQKSNTVQKREKTIFDNEQPKTVQYKFTLTDELKKKYKDITKNPTIIEACELLKIGSGHFSYTSIHGKNKTANPIIIEFAHLTKNKEHSSDDAFGMFAGKKYKIIINDKFQNSPAGALAPIIAREALVSKEKDETDIEMASQLQIAIWTQILEKQPNLAKNKDQLVEMQNKLKQSGNIEEYGAFLSETENPQTETIVAKTEKPEKHHKSKEKGKASQEVFDADSQAESEETETEILSFDSKALEKKYKKVTKEPRIMEALELLKDSVGKFSHDAILGKNVTHRPISIKFKDLSQINPKYSTFDALGWRQAGKLNIYINSKHFDAPAAALAAILSHEALHQDEYDSLNEETYAWTMEASVWSQLCDKNPEVADIAHPLVTRENLLKKLLEKGNYTSKYIKKSVFSNPSYSNLPVRSPGFETDY